MKSHVVLLGRVLEDSSIRCCTSTTNDLKTIIRRVEDEGLSFLTITLPQFASDFERGLEQGGLDSTLFKSFRKRACLPAFLQGFTSQVFDMEDGTLVDEPSLDCIQSIRQICNLFKKLEFPCSRERVEAALKQYVDTDTNVLARMMNMERSKLSEFRFVAGELFRDLFSSVGSDVYNGEIVPRHGPGSTQNRVLGNSKFKNRVWTERLEEYFPAMEFLFTNPAHYLSGYDDVVWLERSQEPPVRVVTVPKTLKTPRIIAIEPVHTQYVQQGLMERFVDGIERDDILSHFIGFTDQEPNRTLACQGSRDGSLATLDLSEASDRVSVQHVTSLFSQHPLLLKSVMACRSEKADIPGYGIKSLAKFASMGSALTFPIEAMVFLTIVMLGIQRESRVPVSSKSIQRLAGKVRVYGDDIIVPVEYVRAVTDELEAFGLRVNSHKSFWTGKFRESCGGEYYDGVDVTYVKFRHSLPQSRRHATELAAAVSFRNQMYMSGYWKTAAYMDEYLSRIIPMPRIHPESPGLGRVSLLDYEIQRWCPNLQRPLVRAAVSRPVIPRDPLDGEDALLKCFLKRGDEPFADSHHLERAGRPVAVDIKLRWVPPY